MKTLNFTTAKALYEAECQREKNALRNSIIKSFNQIRNSLPYHVRKAIDISPPKELSKESDFNNTVRTIQYLFNKLYESSSLSYSNYEEDFVKENEQTSLIDLIKTNNTVLTYNKLASYLTYHFFQCGTFDYEMVEGFVPFRQGAICYDKLGNETKLPFYFGYTIGDDDNTYWTITDFISIKLVFRLNLYFFSEYKRLVEEWNRDNGFAA